MTNTNLNVARVQPSYSKIKDNFFVIVTEGGGSNTYSRYQVLCSNPSGTTAFGAHSYRARRLRELTLVEEARAQGWEREVERHTSAMRRIEQLLADLNEPLEETPMDLAYRPGGSTGTSQPPAPLAR